MKIKDLRLDILGRKEKAGKRDFHSPSDAFISGLYRSGYPAGVLMKYLEAVIESGLFSEIRKSEYIDAYESLKIFGRRYAKGDTVFFEEDVIDRLCILKKGSVRAEKVSLDGEVHIFSVFDERDFFAMEISASREKNSALDYVCNENSEIVFISMSSVEKSRYSEKLERAVMYMLADENIRMAHKSAILGERGLRDRIMAYLSVLKSKSGTDTVTIKMNREQLARYLCVNRSALSNELSKMKKEGLIDFKGRVFRIMI